MLPEDFPTDEYEFHERFNTDEACREYWVKLRWPDGFVCPKCGHHGGWRRHGREEWVCANATCGKETSMRAGTVLHNSPKPLKKWLMAMFHMAVNKQGVSALRLQRLLGFGSYDTAARWLRELRRVLAVDESSGKLGPEVEIDETPLGGVEAGGKGATGKTWVIGAVERRGHPKGCGRARMKVVSERSAATVCGFVCEHVAEGSLVATDGHPSYGGLVDLGYRHDPRTLTKPGGGLYNQLKMANGTEKVRIHLPNVHQVFSLVDRIVLGAYQGSFMERHLQSYLDEYCFRFNRRFAKTPLTIFHQIAARAARSQCVPLWKSRGRETPKKPTRKANTEWQEFGSLLGRCAYGG